MKKACLRSARHAIRNLQTKRPVRAGLPLSASSQCQYIRGQRRSR